MTVLDLIKRSMRLLNAISIGDDPTADEAAAGLMALNAMVDSWATERLMLFTSGRTLYPVTPGKSQYSLGPTAASPDWTGARPMYLDAAGLILPDGSGAERPLHLITTTDEWARVSIKNLPSTLPTSLYLQADYPNATVNLWPAPTQAEQIALYTPTAVSQFTALTQLVSLPPGYARALPFNLAVELAGEFDREPPASVVAIAMESKASIKRANVPGSMGRLRVDAALRGRGSSFDYLTGETR